MYPIKSKQITTTKTRYLISLLTVSMLFTGCSTIEKSILTGALIAGSTGALMGSQSGSSKKTGTGAAIGMAVGGLFGYLVHNQQKKKSGKAKDSTTKQVKEKAPLLNKPKVQRVWMPDKIEGDRYIKGHWMYVIEKNSGWRKHD